MLGFSLVINLLWLAPALFSLQVFDRVLSSQSRETLLVLLLGLTVAMVLVGGLEYLRGRLQGVMGSIVNDALSPEIARITLAQAARRQGPVPMEGLRDVGRLRALFSAQGLLALLDAPWALVFLVVIWLAHPLLGVLATASAALLLGLALLNHHLTRKPIESLQRDAGEAQRYLDLAMQNAEAAEAMGMGPALIHRWQELSAKVATQQGPTARLTVGMSTLTKVLRQLVQVLLQAAGAYLVIKAESTPGVLVASTMLLGRALAPVEQIVGSWRVISEGLLAWRRLEPMLADRAHQAPPMELPRPNGVLLAQNLSYRVGDKLLLSNVGLALHAGEALAIIGPSGAGKSTLIRLLIGVWQPSTGSVRLDGVDVSKWSRDQLGQHIGYLPQDVELFAGTVAENIARLGDVEPQRVVAAAQLAGVHELILGLAQGYDTRIDPHGALLSPGQRQRIGLARAVYGEPRLIVLDEPNANLDAKGNEALAKALGHLKGRATVIMVTHRHDVIAHADKMLVIEEGRATVFGSPSQVDQFLRQRAGQGPAPRPIAVRDEPAARAGAASRPAPLVAGPSATAPAMAGVRGVAASPAQPPAGRSTARVTAAPPRATDAAGTSPPGTPAVSPASRNPSTAGPSPSPMSPGGPASRPAALAPQAAAAPAQVPASPPRPSPVRPSRPAALDVAPIDGSRNVTMAPGATPVVREVFPAAAPAPAAVAAPRPPAAARPSAGETVAATPAAAPVAPRPSAPARDAAPAAAGLPAGIDVNLDLNLDLASALPSGAATPSRPAVPRAAHPLKNPPIQNLPAPGAATATRPAARPVVRDEETRPAVFSASPEFRRAAAQADAQREAGITPITLAEAVGEPPAAESRAALARLRPEDLPLIPPLRKSSHWGELSPSGHPESGSRPPSAVVKLGAGRPAAMPLPEGGQAAHSSPAIAPLVASVTRLPVAGRKDAAAASSTHVDLPLGGEA